MVVSLFKVSPIRPICINSQASKLTFFDSLTAYDFFTRQPIEGAAVYCLRFVLHDWDTAKCIEILKNTRAAAGPSSTLIIWDHFVPNACPGIDSKTGVSLLPLGMDWATGIDMQVGIHIFYAR